MNEKQVSFEDFRKEQKKRERKEKLYNVVKKCTDWIRSNKEIAIGIGTFAVGAGGSMIKGLAKRQKVKEEKQLKNNYCYDSNFFAFIILYVKNYKILCVCFCLFYF